MLDWVTDPQIWIAFLTLAALEIVLGIDNIIFISILVGQAAAGAAASAARTHRPGAGDAHAHRCCCCRSPGSMRLTAPLFTVARARRSRGAT